MIRRAEQYFGSPAESTAFSIIPGWVQVRTFARTHRYLGLATMETLSAVSSALLGGQLKLLTVPVVAMGLLYGSSAVYRRVFSRGQEQTSFKRRPVNRRQNVYRVATSLLDTEGNILTPWRPDDSSPAAATAGNPAIPAEAAPAAADAHGVAKKTSVTGADGWFNLGIVLLLLFVVTNAIHNNMSFGSLFRDQGRFVLDVLQGLPELGRDWAILGLVYFSFTLGYQYLVMFAGLRGLPAYILQGIAEGGMLLGCVLYSAQRPHWPLTQRLAWLMETTVLLMKMHSYIVVNRHLQLEVESGGPGTGAIVFQLERLDSLAAAAAAAKAAAGGSEELPGKVGHGALGSGAAPAAAAPHHVWTSRSPAAASRRHPSASPKAAGSPASAAKMSASSPLSSPRRVPGADSAQQAGSAVRRRRRAGSEADGSTAASKAAASRQAIDTAAVGGAPGEATAAGAASVGGNGGGGAGMGTPSGGSTRSQRAPSQWQRELDLVGIEEAAEAGGDSAALFGLRDIAFFPPKVQARAARAASRGGATPGAGSNTHGNGHATPADVAGGVAAAEPAAAEDHTPAEPAPGVASPVSSTSSGASAGSASGDEADAQAPGFQLAGRGAELLGLSAAAARQHTRELMHHAKYARRLLGQLVYGLNYERQLTTTSIVAYPANVSVRDLLLFSFAPVLCYEPSFPRTESIRPAYLAEKIFLAAGLLTAGIYVLSHYVLPVVDRIGCLGEVDAAVQLMVPLMAIMLLLFFLIFECVLNAFAELTRFGARSHYGDWWNATTFLEWSRAWNLPVHDWLARHVYLDAMRQYGAAANAALTFTFLVSIVLHEVVIWGVLGRVTVPWLGLFSLLQLPLGSIQRVGIIKGKRLGNMILWAGLAIGVALIFTLYAKEVAPPCASA